MSRRFYLLVPVSIVIYLIFVCVFTNAQNAFDVEINALFALYNSTNGDFWLWRDELSEGPKWNFTRNSNGSFLDNPCSSGTSNSTWQGVLCSNAPPMCVNRECHITVLSLQNFNLNGSIPYEIGDLAFLTTINFDQNHLAGPIINAIFNLSMLQILDLGNNQMKGNISHKISDLRLLEFLSLEFNYLTGYIPREMFNLTRLEFMYLDYNQLSGPIRSEVGDLAFLVALGLDDNQLTGCVPAEIGTLELLEHLSLGRNQLTGSIFIEIFNMTRLSWLDLDNNLLTGTISNEIGNLTLLEFLDLDYNLLTGPLPKEIVHLARLEILDLGGNQFTGAIPGDIGDLALLKFLDLDFNLLTGIIPSAIGDLEFLEWLELDHNQLEGCIPSEIGSLTLLEILELGGNELKGHIPFEIGNLVLLSFLDLSDNKLTGYLPSSFGCLHNLVNLFLQNNALDGSIGVTFNYSAQLALENIDLSNNLLSGSLPDDVFRLPSLRVLALSVNCFDSELSPNMCRAESIEVLSLNGLRSAEGCRHMFMLPLSGVYLFNTIGGIVPKCLWGLRNLTVLHLTGNGLTGELVPSLPRYSRLLYLSLSHNQLRGPMPPDILMISTLDLSYNQLEGGVPVGISLIKNTYLTLKINRLSGKLPQSHLENGNVSYLNILRGNLFSCDSIPENDEFSEFYACGSETLDEALYIFGSVLVFCTTMLVIYLVVLLSQSSFSKSEVVSQSYEIVSLLWMYATHIDSLEFRSSSDNPHTQKIIALADTFKKAKWLFVKLMVVLLLVGSPLYIIQVTDSNGSYSTHTDTYTWFWTLAFVSGVLPASLILLSWIILITVCFYYLLLLPMFDKDVGDERQPLVVRGRQNSDSVNCAIHRNVSKRTEDKVQNCLSTPMKLLFNAFVASVVNVAYIYAIQKEVSPFVQFSILLSLTIFRLVYSQVVIPELTKSIVDPISNIDLRFHLLSVSNVIIPCIVTAFTSPSCFQGLLIEADSVSTPYSYEECTRFLLGTCVEFTRVEVDSASVIPPFSYSNQCTSVLLTAYIPVIILGSSIQLLLCLVMPLVFISAEKILINQKVIVYRQVIGGIFWTNFWLDSDNDLESEKRKHLENSPTTILSQKSTICIDILNNLMIVLTFGLCSPFVVFAVTCVVVSKMKMWILLIGRFCILITQGSTERDTHYALVALSRIYISFEEVCTRSFWLLAWSSSLFCGMICWDIAVAGEAGWLDSLWIPMFAVFYPSFLWVIAHCFEQKLIRGLQRGDCNEKEVTTRETETELVSALSEEFITK